MTVRAKLLASMALLVLFMAGVFFALTRGYLVKQFQQYATAAETQDAAQWARVVHFYYMGNGQSWPKAATALRELLHDSGSDSDADDGPKGAGSGGYDHTDRLIVVNQAGKRVLDVTDGDNDGARVSSDSDAAQMTSYPLEFGNFTGRLYVADTSPSSLLAVEQRILRSMTLAIVWGMLLATVVALVLGFFLSKRITGPLQRLSRAILQMGRGDWDVAVDVNSQDEVGQLASAFDEMRDKLRSGEQARKQLVADVAHELRTPLTILEGQLELVQQGVKSAAPETFVPMLDEVIRLSGLVEDLHQLSLADAGQLTLHLEPTSLFELTARVVDNFAVEAESRDVLLTMSESPDQAAPLADPGAHRSPAQGPDTPGAHRSLAQGPATPGAHRSPAQGPDTQAPDTPPPADADGRWVTAVDPRRLTQVLVNLVDNALKHTPQGGRVHVALSADPEHVRIAVSDTGPGIDPRHLPHVFDRFYRSDSNRARSTGGMGLGLAIAKGFVEAHQGHIEVASTLGEGATFTVVLPNRRKRP